MVEAVVEEFALSTPDRRSPIAIGFEWASRISVVGVTLVLPVLAGHWLDRYAGSNPFGLLVGMVIGFGVGLVQLLQLARSSSQPRP